MWGTVARARGPRNRHPLPLCGIQFHCMESTRTVDRALGLLAAAVDGPQTLSELARGAALAPSTTSRLLGALQRHGFVQRGDDGRFRSGSELVRLAAATLRGEPAYELAAPHLAALTEETGETANLGVRAEGDRVLYLRQSVSPRTVRAESWVGRTIPLRGTALGAALTGALGPEGYTVSTAAVEPDVTAIAAPFHDHHGRVAGALSVTAPTYRTSAEDAAAHGRALAEHAAGLSRELGAA
jgi:IclR family transcriptional regulator, acetate operon repressor